MKKEILVNEDTRLEIQAALDEVQKKIRKRKIDAEYVITVVETLERMIGDNLEGMRITVYPGEYIKGYTKNALTKYQAQHIIQKCTAFNLEWRKEGCYIQQIRRTIKNDVKVVVKELPKNGRLADLKAVLGCKQCDYYV